MSVPALNTQMSNREKEGEKEREIRIVVVLNGAAHRELIILRHGRLSPVWGITSAL